jgi:hypothetical protein
MIIFLQPRGTAIFLSPDHDELYPIWHLRFVSAPGRQLDRSQRPGHRAEDPKRANGVSSIPALFRPIRRPRPGPNPGIVAGRMPAAQSIAPIRLWI